MLFQTWIAQLMVMNQGQCFEKSSQRKLMINKKSYCFLTERTVWMEPIINFKKTGQLPSDHVEAKYVKVRDKWLKLWDETLYKKSFNRPLMKCITWEDGL